MGIWSIDKRLDYFDIVDEKIKRNSLGVTAICMVNDLLDTGDGYHTLRVKTYGKLYDLCTSEPFYEQPAVVGSICTGVLVTPDMVLTAAHFVHESNVTKLGFVFGYEMADTVSPVIRFPNEKIYYGVRILRRRFDTLGPNATGSDWALVQLDRQVEGQEITALSKQPVFPGQNLYVLGYPCGLPLKYAPGKVVKSSKKSYFTVEADIFSGNVGSPVFNAETHEIVGIVSRSDPMDFRRIDDCCTSVVYPNSEILSYGAQCTKVSEFNEYFAHTKDKDGVQIKHLEIDITSQNEKFLEGFIAVVEKNLSDPDFNIDALCDKLLIGRSTLFRKIQALTEETPNEFIQSYRLERAVQLLRDDFRNVVEVAGAVGFSNPYYFSKCFKQKFHQSPKQYQLEHLKKNQEKPINKKVINEKSNGMKIQDILPSTSSIELLDRELVGRGALMMAAQQLLLNGTEGTPQSQEIFNQVMEYYALHSTLNEALKHFETNELVQRIRQMSDDKILQKYRSGLYADDCLDLFDIFDDRVRGNALSVAVVCMYWDLLPSGGGYFQLKTKNFGKVFNLHVSEPFYNQPVAAGPMCTGILVGKNVIATAAHFSNGKNVADLCFVFDFIMQDPISPVEQIPQDNIYKGVEILERVHNPEGDWMLVKLDRNVAGREVAVLSRRNIFYEQPVYVIGHPCGLPLKYAPGACVEEINDNYFRADLDVYSGNSGSPVFCAETHELIGIVSKGKATDFRWTEEGWITLRYPKTDPDYRGSQCSRTSDFEKLLK